VWPEKKICSQILGTGTCSFKNRGRGWSLARPLATSPRPPGMARHGLVLAWPGQAWLGTRMASHGIAWPGMAWYSHGMARPGTAAHGQAWLGTRMAWPGLVLQRTAWYWPGTGMVLAWYCSARPGTGMAITGMA